MMARISRSRTPKLIPVRAFTPPKQSETSSTTSNTAPLLRPAVMPGSWPSCCLPRVGSGQGFRLLDPQIGGNHAAAAILPLHHRLDMLHVLVRIQRVDKHAILFSDEVAAHLACSCQLV